MTTTMETGLERIAEAAACYEPSSPQREVARLRVADALFSYQLGRALPVASLADGIVGPVLSSAPAAVAFGLAACIRYTEIDDLLLSCCVSPGAMVIPSIVAVASLDRALAFDDLLDATVVGYGVAAWLGERCGGARSVTRGAWPSRAVAPMTAALCAGRALGLDQRGLLEAASLASVWRAEGRLAEPGRELSFGRAVGIGVEAAFAAARGVQPGMVPGDDRLLPIEDGGPWGLPVPVVDGVVLGGAGSGSGTLEDVALDRAVLDARMKLLCAARQVMPALVAVNRALGAAGAADLDALGGIELELPEACAVMVDVPRVATRLDSLRSVQYQLAAMLLSPDELWDVERSELALAPDAEALAASISVRSSADLEGAFPACWPARATVRIAGVATTALVPDDPPARLDVACLQAKQQAFCGPDPAAGALAAAVLEACDTSKSAGDLFSLACLIAEASSSDETIGRRTAPLAVRGRLGSCR